MTYGHGSSPSICFHLGDLWLVLQDFASLRLYRGESLHRAFTLTDEGSGFPQIASFDGVLWLAFREGATGLLIRIDTGEVFGYGRPGGNSPHLLADGYVWWLEGDGCWKAPVANPTAAERVNNRITPTGLVAIVNGQPVYWDDVAGSYPGMVASSIVGPLVAGEGHSGGAVVRDAAMGRERVFWPGRESFKPALAVDAARYAVASYSNADGVRAERFTAADLNLPGPPPPDPDPDPEPEPTPMTPNRSDVVRDLFQQFPPAANSTESCAIFTRRVAYALNPEGHPGGWGLLTKSPGETQHDGYAVDAIIYGQTQQVVDIIGGAEGPNPQPGWLEVPKRDNNNWAKPIKVEGTPPPPPVDPPASGVQAQIDALVKCIAVLESRPTGGSVNGKRLAFKSAHGRYVCIEPDGRVIADRSEVGGWEVVTVEEQR